MANPRTSIVVTTIFEPRFVDGYLDNLDRHGRRESAELIVIIDRKTPATVASACVDARKRGFRVECPTLDEQEAFLAKFPSMKDRIPYNTDNRRNVGFLMALDRGSELLISIDDDNYCLDDSDFVGEHAIVGETIDGTAVESSDGWFNIGSLLTTSTPVEIYPRGFPYFARRTAEPGAQTGVSVPQGSSNVSVGEADRRGRLSSTVPFRARVAMNAGLWLSDPDVDAISRIALAPHVSEASREGTFLGPRTWSPINTQNTAIARDAVAAYYYVRMGFSLGGLTIDRYGDILSGYLAAACVKAKGETIRIGSPVADHRRTPHNLFKDLYHELAGVVIVDEILPLLTSAKLSGSTYPELYASLADLLDERSSSFHGFIWDQGGGAFLRETAGHMRAWLEAVRQIG